MDRKGDTVNMKRFAMCLCGSMLRAPGDAQLIFVLILTRASDLDLSFTLCVCASVRPDGTTTNHTHDGH